MKKGKISLITIYTLAILMLIVFGGKGLISNISNQNSAVVTAAKVGDVDEISLSNEHILANLSSVLHTNEGNETDSTISILYSTLESYFTQEDVKLTNGQVYLLNQKINKLNEIIQSEQETEVTQMSLGGKLSFMKVMERIYHIFGLQLSYNLSGNVYGVENMEGQRMYYKEIQSKWSFPVVELISLIIICGVLAMIPYHVARKNKYSFQSGAWNMLHIGKKEWKKA